SAEERNRRGSTSVEADHHTTRHGTVHLNRWEAADTPEPGPPDPAGGPRSRVGRSRPPRKRVHLNRWEVAEPRAAMRASIVCAAMMHHAVTEDAGVYLALRATGRQWWLPGRRTHDGLESR
ncbi:hypothetical protein, partial [Pseudonocardia sp.]|uniref:hypothetical protein n=1 Tax=Pseudonocardia sp. TaxID=60912 RepID=UPI0026392E33